MLQCECGGMLFVIRVEEYPYDLKDKINYDRVCDVECEKCGKVYYSQPYDFGKNINIVRNSNNKKGKPFRAQGD